MPRPPAYDSPCIHPPQRPIGDPGVAQILSGDVVVLLPAPRGRVVMFPLNLLRDEPRSRD